MATIGFTTLIVDKKKWEKLVRDLTQINGTVAVGLPQGGKVKGQALNGDKTRTYPDLVKIGTVHEFGAPQKNIPRRSFIKDTINIKMEMINKLRLSLIVKTMMGKIDGKKALNTLGVAVVGMIKRRIKSNIPPGLKDSTIRRKTINGKAGNVALIDSGQLWQSITHKVEINK